MASLTNLVRRAKREDLQAIRQLIMDSYMAMSDYAPKLSAFWETGGKNTYSPEGDLHENNFDQYLVDFENGSADLNYEKEAAFWVAELNSQVIGCVGLRRIHTGDAELVRMAVDPHLRGGGFGLKLVQELTNYCTRRGFLRVHCTTANTSAARFYCEKCGFIVKSKRDVHLVLGPDQEGDFVGQSLVKHVGERIVRSVAVIGGTHGNERVGVELVERWQQQMQIVDVPSSACMAIAESDLYRSTLKTYAIIGNPAAVHENIRYIDQDLNRQFSRAASSALHDSQAAKQLIEQRRAQDVMNFLMSLDFSVDLHSTTSNVGIILMIPGGDFDPYATRIAYLLQQQYPELNIRITFSKGMKRTAWSIDAISESGLSVEIGPLPHGTLDESLLSTTRMLVQQILNYIEERNKTLLKLSSAKIDLHELWLENIMGDERQQILLPRAPFVAYEMVQYVKYPVSESLSAEQYRLHPALSGQDWQELVEGTPLFIHASKPEEVILFEKAKHVEAQEHRGKSLFMLFIEEPAYTRNGIAFALYERVEKSLY